MLLKSEVRHNNCISNNNYVLFIDFRLKKTPVNNIAVKSKTTQISSNIENIDFFFIHFFFVVYITRPDSINYIIKYKARGHYLSYKR